MSERHQLTLAESYLYKAEVEQKSLPALAGGLLAAGVREIRAHLLVSETPLNLSFQRSENGIGHELEVLVVSPTSISGRLSGSFGRDHQHRATGLFVAVRHPEHAIVWTLITHSGRKFEDNPLESFISSIRPRCTRPIFQTDQIRSLLGDVGALPAARDLRVRQFGSRAKIKSKGASKTLESDRKWTDLSIDEAFSEIRSEGHWITDASIQFRYYSIPNASLKITRYGVFTFRRVAGEVLSSCISSAARMARERFEFLNGRARSKSTDFKIRPFNIEFGSAVFDARDQIRLFQSALKKMPSVTCTVLHGNPYFHAVLVDYYDGSCYEVLIISKSHLTVIPQGRSTVGALQRFCAAVFFGFREGELQEVSNV